MEEYVYPSTCKTCYFCLVDRDMKANTLCACQVDHKDMQRIGSPWLKDLRVLLSSTFNK